MGEFRWPLYFLVNLSCCRWVRTGDEVMINENADLFVVDRLKVRRVGVHDHNC
jgi:hypothetical protein